MQAELTYKSMFNGKAQPITEVIISNDEVYVTMSAWVNNASVTEAVVNTSIQKAA